MACYLFQSDHPADLLHVRSMNPPASPQERERWSQDVLVRDLTGPESRSLLQAVFGDGPGAKYLAKMDHNLGGSGQLIKYFVAEYLTREKLKPGEREGASQQEALEQQARDLAAGLSRYPWAMLEWAPSVETLSPTDLYLFASVGHKLSLLPGQGTLGELGGNPKIDLGDLAAKAGTDSPLSAAYHLLQGLSVNRADLCLPPKPPPQGQIPKTSWNGLPRNTRLSSQAVWNQRSSSKGPAALSTSGSNDQAGRSGARSCRGPSKAG